MGVLLCQGDAMHLPLADESCHVCVTSPPYWHLRSYGCGAGELGMEDSHEDYIDAMTQAFSEVWRVLRHDGTLWLNVGTTYQDGQDLGIPWRLAFALKADGWRLRSEIIFHKVNPMPESVQTRPTRAHEQVFLFSKSPQYHFDALAVREPAQDWGLRDRSLAKHNTEGFRSAGQPPHHGLTNGNCAGAGRACRSVWSLASESFSGAHYACFPTALVRRCLLAGAPSRVCAACGTPWVRKTARTFRPMTDRRPAKLARASGIKGIDASRHDATSPRGYTDMTTLGFEPSCACNAGVGKAVVLDPFVGSGTTLLVARELGHHAVGVDLSLNYLRNIARERLGLKALQEWQNGQPPQQDCFDDLPLFA